MMYATCQERCGAADMPLCVDATAVTAPPGSATHLPILLSEMQTVVLSKTIRPGHCPIRASLVKQLHITQQVVENSKAEP